ncbi:MAG: GNAT family N-acetyltransferase [Candidatus Micrarchaeota archaeon]|nr:GNAT family N-acetyltransferase [Candidatus Micrarchaeota archaeon]
MKIRKMTRADLPALAEMNADAFRDITAKQAMSFLLGTYAHKVDGACLVAEEKGQLVGAIFGNRKITYVSKTAEIPSLFISKRFQGKGIGKALLKACLSAMKKKGIQSVSLTVRSNDRRAQNLYAKAGFKPFRLMLLRRF